MRPLKRSYIRFLVWNPCPAYNVHTDLRTWSKRRWEPSQWHVYDIVSVAALYWHYWYSSGTIVVLHWYRSGTVIVAVPVAYRYCIGTCMVPTQKCDHTADTEPAQNQ